MSWPSWLSTSLACAKERDPLPGAVEACSEDRLSLANETYHNVKKKWFVDGKIFQRSEK